SRSRASPTAGRPAGRAAGSGPAGRWPERCRPGRRRAGRPDGPFLGFAGRPCRSPSGSDDGYGVAAPSRRCLPRPPRVGGLPERAVFTADAKILARVAPLIQRAMIVDPNLAAARLLADVLKGLGGREVVFEQDERRALELAREFDPQIIFTERSGPRLDGEELTRRLRRSNMSCRQAPVIMITAEATAVTIKGARDAGVHEFLRKPFTSGDLFKRIEVVTLKPRDWIEAVGYVGPDRRRFNSGEYTGPHKRKADKPRSADDAHAAAADQAVRILSAALDQFDRDPMQALRAMRQQAVTLKAMAIKGGDTRLAIAAAGLDQALAQPNATRISLAAPVNAVLAMAATEPVARAS